MPKRSSSVPAEAKTCESCGRTMTWRRAWADAWPDVRWCSAACRRRKVTAQDRALEGALRDLLRSTAGPVMTDDAARLVGGSVWKQLVEPARRAARRMHAAGEAEVVQSGRLVDPSTARGPFAVRRP